MEWQAIALFVALIRKNKERIKMSYLCLYAEYHFIPAIILLAVIHSKDKQKKEKKKGFLFALFIAGAGISLLLLMVSWMIGSVIMKNPALSNNSTFRLTMEMLSILIGEIVKFLVLKRITWKSRYFRYRYDAVIYATLISFGFSLFRNFTFSFGGYLSQQILMLLPTEAFLVCVGVFQGWYYAKAKYNALDHKKLKGWDNMLPAILVPALHRGILQASLIGSENLVKNMSSDIPAWDNAAKGVACGIALMLIPVMIAIVIYVLIVCIKSFKIVTEESAEKRLIIAQE